MVYFYFRFPNALSEKLEVLDEKSQFGSVLTNKGKATVKFKRSFSQVPCVFLQIKGASGNVLGIAKVSNVTKDGFDVVVVVYSGGSAIQPSYNVDVNWLAVI